MRLGVCSVELTELSPPAHVSSTGCPAVILAGGFVKAMIWLCATAATTTVAHARRVLPSIVIVVFVELMREEEELK